ncbi:MAG: putative oxygen-independent coproporphyrinogen oxidase, partial [Actinomycetota bacterium]
MHSTSSSVPEGVAPFGVYVHVPFCASRCDYCAFATWTDRHHLQDDYLAAMAAEIDRAALGPVTSVFVGGGTPTAVDPEGLMRVLAHIPLVPGAEVTVECNPDDVTPSLMEAYVAGGVNRVSMGVQSMVPHVLASLGRRHRPENVRSAVAAARTASLERINLDLIYGGAGESLDDWRTTIEAVLALEPPHVSAYALTVEAGTPL